MKTICLKDKNNSPSPTSFIQIKAESEFYVVELLSLKSVSECCLNVTASLIYNYTF